MREKYIEQKLVSEVKKRGGICLKLASTGLDGIPDRLPQLSNRRDNLWDSLDNSN